MNKGSIRLYNKLKKKRYCPENICEVGVYLPEESNLIRFINEGITVTLVEADPTYIAKINKYFENHKNVSVIEAAVFDFHGKIELSRRESSTFISQLESSPALINDNYKINETDKFIANSILFSEIDNAKFDLISIDIEGAEWYVIKHMISRPNIISIETHGKYYTNAKIDLIERWMSDNNYVPWYKDESDTVFIIKGTFRITTKEKLQIFAKNIVIDMVKKKKAIKTIFSAK